MGFPTKVQLIQRKASEQWYINFPSAVAQALEFAKGETVEWIIADKGHLILSRKDVPPSPVDLEKQQRGTEWAATGKVERTAAVPADFPTETAVSVVKLDGYPKQEAPKPKKK